MIEKLLQKIMMLVGRGRVLTGRDDGPIQRLQVKLSADDIKDNTARMAEYGFASFPPVGSDAVVLFLNGDRSNGVIVATGHQTFRMKNLKPGEVAISDNLGQSIYLSEAGIVVQGAGLPVTVNGITTINGNTTINGDLIATGSISDLNGASGTLQHVRDQYDIHHHDVGGVTSSTPTPTI